MERGDEETTKESARGGAGAAGRIGAERGQAARQSRKWPQGRPGEKPQETYRGAPQRPASAPRPRQEVIEILIAAIRARFGPRAIALGNAGIRHTAAALR